MSEDKIAEIRARHERENRLRLTASMMCSRAHNDRAVLLAEVERLRAALIEWDALIQHQYSGSRDAMTDMQYAIFRTRQILDELDAPRDLEAKP